MSLARLLQAIWWRGYYSDLWIKLCLFCRSLQLMAFIKFPVANCACRTFPLADLGSLGDL